MIAILFLLTALIATIAVTITAGLAVLVVYLWRKYMIALRAALQALNNAYQSVLLEQTFTAPMGAQQVPGPEKLLLFVAKNYNTMH